MTGSPLLPRGSFQRLSLNRYNHTYFKLVLPRCHIGPLETPEPTFYSFFWQTLRQEHLAQLLKLAPRSNLPSSYGSSSSWFWILSIFQFYRLKHTSRVIFGLAFLFFANNLGQNLNYNLNLNFRCLITKTALGDKTLRVAVLAHNRQTILAGSTPAQPTSKTKETIKSRVSSKDQATKTTSLAAHRFRAQIIEMQEVTLATSSGIRVQPTHSKVLLKRFVLRTFLLWISSSIPTMLTRVEC